MSDEPDSLTLRYLRRIDEKIDRLGDDLRDAKQRLTTLETQVGHQAATEASHYAGLSMRLDRVEARLDRIERRLDLVDTPA